jgi:hypothetical protein
MKESITLQELYNRTVALIPSETHSIKIFKEKILMVLQEDAIRTFSVQKRIKQEGKSFKIYRTFPLNDFYDGIRKYAQEVIEKDIPLKIDSFKEYIFSNDEK